MSDRENALDRFIENLPAKPYCSEDPRRFGVRPRQRDIAARYPYLQPNAPSRIAYIALDVDKQGAAFVAEDAGMPWPTFAVVNPKTTHAHLLYDSRPVYPGRSDKADRFLNAVRGGLTETLGADSAYHGLLCRTRCTAAGDKSGLKTSSPWRISRQPYRPNCCHLQVPPLCGARWICRAATSTCSIRSAISPIARSGRREVKIDSATGCSTNATPITPSIRRRSRIQK